MKEICIMSHKLANLTLIRCLHSNIPLARVCAYLHFQVNVHAESEL